jgi:hypothetical protein
MSNKRKGDILEDITAWLHDEPGITVQKRVRLPTRHRDGRRREVDVLLSRDLAGYPVQIAIECKNQRKPVGSPIVDGFIGKLQDVGIPVSHGILVSANGYTKPALKRGSQDNLRMLEFAGLSKDGLKALVSDCFQSLVYAFASVQNVIIETPIGTFDPEYNVYAFFDKNGTYCGTIFDLIWRNWINGNLPQDIGTHEISLSVPADYVQKGSDIVAAPLKVTVILKVVVFVVTLKGEVKDFGLTNVETNEHEKRKITATFPNNDQVGPLKVFEKDEELRKYLTKPTLIAYTTTRLPRILILNKCYFPLREATIEKMKDLMDAGEQIETFTELEGADLAAIWEDFD